jgi:hypothetical protein
MNEYGIWLPAMAITFGALFFYVVYKLMSAEPEELQMKKEKKR